MEGKTGETWEQGWLKLTACLNVVCVALQIALGLPCITGVHISELLNPSQHMNHLGSLWVPHAQQFVQCVLNVDILVTTNQLLH